ncbi:MAG: aminotransferase class III-fold pyridoxal phosphate-dependent enzyme [Proteobacteria bacterium]|nr:aminotransferase class III-fold pyridoxal phosphate-dependent enzyme [Pseudomonadota bacterium]
MNEPGMISHREPSLRGTEQFAELLQNPWVIDTYRQIGERQKKSIELVSKLRPVNATSSAFFPFHAPAAPLCVARAQGSRIRDVDGNEYLDCFMGWGAQALHGHNPEPVVAAVRDLIGTGVGNGYFHELELRHAELLRELMPHCEKFAFFHSGTDATFAAIRLARAHTGKRLVAKVEGGLHGIHDLAMQNTAFWYHGYPDVPYPEMDNRGVRATSPLVGVANASDEDILILPHNESSALELIERHRNELACVIAEPVSTSFPFEEESIAFVRKLAVTSRMLRVPFILDEVLSGFRSGIGGMAASHQIRADLYTYGKVISGLGLPFSALGGRADLLDIAQSSGMSKTDLGRKTCLHTTHIGNQLAMAASHATLLHLRDKGPDYYTQTRAKVSWLRDRLGEFSRRHDIPIKLAGFGDFIGCFTVIGDAPVHNTREFEAATNPLAMYVLTLMLRKRGVYTFSIPMLFTGGAHSRADIELLYEHVADSLLEMQREGLPLATS